MRKCKLCGKQKHPSGNCLGCGYTSFRKGDVLIIKSRNYLYSNFGDICVALGDGYIDLDKKKRECVRTWEEYPESYWRSSKDDIKPKHLERIGTMFDA